MEGKYEMWPNPLGDGTLELFWYQHSTKFWIYSRVLLFAAGFATRGPLENSVKARSIRTIVIGRGYSLGFSRWGGVPGWL